MRIPGTRIYRAFPELDRFSDADCAAWIERAKERGGKVLALAPIVTGCVLLPVGAVLAFVLSRFADETLDILTLTVSVFAAVVVGVPTMSTLLVRDRLLRRAIRAAVLGATCPRCAYSLLGLRVTEGAVRCPECAHLTVLAERDLTPDDILAGKALAPPGYSSAMTELAHGQAAPKAGYAYKIAVLCDLRDRRGRLLLIKRAKDPNKGLYSPIGGKLDTALGESPAQCARREILEEASLDIPIDRLRLTGIISERGYEGKTNWLMFWYRALDPVDLHEHEINEGSLEWHALADIPSLPLPDTDRRVIWPHVLRHDPDGFFAVHIDCTGDEIRWSTEQSSPPTATPTPASAPHA
ncbi:MAG: NUDIX domain-containing protein [Phycisphaerales bacterium]|nr:NUDIX domain-containing protein [Phycisphaerales bacterium]